MPPNEDWPLPVRLFAWPALLSITWLKQRGAYHPVYLKTVKWLCILAPLIIIGTTILSTYRVGIETWLGLPIVITFIYTLLTGFQSADMLDLHIRALRPDGRPVMERIHSQPLTAWRLWTGYLSAWPALMIENRLDPNSPNYQRNLKIAAPAAGSFLIGLTLGILLLPQPPDAWWINVLTLTGVAYLFVISITSIVMLELFATVNAAGAGTSAGGRRGPTGG